MIIAMAARVQLSASIKGPKFPSSSLETFSMIHVLSQIYWNKT